MKIEKPVVVGIGELLWDMLPTGKRAGGAPINFVYHATQLGAEGYALSAVGRDELGTEILEELEKNHIDNLVNAVDYPTGTVKVTLHDGNPTYTIVEGVAWDHIPLTEKAQTLVRKANAVCFGTLALRSDESCDTIFRLLRSLPDRCMRFFDVNIRQHFYTKFLIAELLKEATVLKVNDEELALLRTMFNLEGDDRAACLWFLKRCNLDYVILTAGAAFSTVYSATEESTIQTPKVKVVDTVGAGDSFSGAFVYSILTGHTLQEAHRCAVETAAFVCTKDGAWPVYH